jgi:hypothetical protein
MQSIAAPATAGKPESRIELLLARLRVARLRAKLAAVEFDCLGVALRGGFVSYDDAEAWLDEADLFRQHIDSD